MKLRIFALVIFVLLCASGCAQKNTPNAPQPQQYSRAEYRQGTTGNGLSLVRISSPVVRGSNCELTVQGRPGVEYSASAVYRIGNDNVSTLEKKKANEAGLVSWIWLVNANTNPGVYTVSVAGGGETLTATYTVTQ